MKKLFGCKSARLDAKSAVRETLRKRMAEMAKTDVQDMLANAERGNGGKGAGRSKKVPRTAKPVAPNSFRLGYLIHDVSRMRRTLVDQHMRPEGITRSQWWVLANLSRHGADGIMSTELARLLDVGKVTLGGLIDRLEIAGYVYRRPDKQDRRAKHIFITEAGYALIDRMRHIAEDLNTQMCAGLSKEDISTTELNLIRLKDNLRDLLGDAKIEDD
jgi:MarR family transcriptional regulator for hemolysin